MLTRFIHAAMSQAHYEILDGGSFYGEIPPCQGVFAHAPTLEACRVLLQEVLEEWIMLGLRLGHTLPEIDGIRLHVSGEAA